MAYLRKLDEKKRGNPSKESRKSQSELKSVMPTFTPSLMPAGEDEASQLRHEKLLKQEMKKVNPNKETVQELMRRSFFLQRRSIIEGALGSVQNILSQYPALKYPKEV